MSNTTHATTPPQTSATASPTETPPAPPSQTPQHHTETQPRPKRSPLHPKHPMSPAFHRSGLHFEQALGGFCDHRPPTRRNAAPMVVIPPKPPTNTSHTTRTTGQGCRTRPTPPHHLRHRQQPHPLKHPKHPMSPRFHRGGLHFEQPYGRFRTIDPSTGTRPWPIQATTRGVLRP